MPKIPLHIYIDKDVYETMMNNKGKVLKDGDLHFFKIQTSSKNAWYNFVLMMGNLKIKEEFEKFKKRLNNEP